MHCQMFKPVRVVAAIVFLASIGMIFVAAFVIKSDVRAQSIHKSTYPHQLYTGHLSQ